MDPFSFGEKFRVRVLGSSHGPQIGVEIDGCPQGIAVSEADIQLQLDRRKPGMTLLASQRKEADKLIVEEGLDDGLTTGGNIRLSIKNEDVRPADYKQLEQIPRPGHADFPAFIKYGKIESGGGFFSGRMTAAFVMAGGVAKAFLRTRGITTLAFLQSAGVASVGRPVLDEEIEQNTYQNPVHTAVPKRAQTLADEIDLARRDGDSVGGVVEGRVLGLPAGIGDPLFASLESRLSAALFAIPAVKGVEFGSGFSGSRARGSENNDAFEIRDGRILTATNNSGGILGGLSTGMPLVFRCAFKPTPSIFKSQQSVNLKTMERAELHLTGRHDPCVAVRAVPVVENTAAFVLADVLLCTEVEK